jgi:hypothetical protein
MNAARHNPAFPFAVRDGTRISAGFAVSEKFAIRSVVIPTATQFKICFRLGNWLPDSCEAFTSAACFFAKAVIDRNRKITGPNIFLG